MIKVKYSLIVKTCTEERGLITTHYPTDGDETAPELLIRVGKELHGQSIINLRLHRKFEQIKPAEYVYTQ